METTPAGAVVWRAGPGVPVGSEQGRLGADRPPALNIDTPSTEIETT